MIQNILFMLIAGMLAVASPSILWAASNDVVQPATTAPVSEGNSAVAPDMGSSPAKASDEKGYLDRAG